jgi:hypothetical protein
VPVLKEKKGAGESFHFTRRPEKKWKEKELFIPHHIKNREEVERKEAQHSSPHKTHHKKRLSNKALTVTKHLYFT